MGDRHRIRSIDLGAHIDRVAALASAPEEITRARCRQIEGFPSTNLPIGAKVNRNRSTRTPALGNHYLLHFVGRTDQINGVTPLGIGVVGVYFNPQYVVGKAIFIRHFKPGAISFDACRPGHIGSHPEFGYAALAG